MTYQNSQKIKINTDQSHFGESPLSGQPKGCYIYAVQHNKPPQDLVVKTATMYYFLQFYGLTGNPSVGFSWTHECNNVQLADRMGTGGQLGRPQRLDLPLHVVLYPQGG